MTPPLRRLLVAIAVTFAVLLPAAPARADNIRHGVRAISIPAVDPTTSPTAQTFTATPSPGTGGPAGKGRSAAGIGIVVLFVALAVLATMWIRRAAARYRRRLRDDER